MNETITQLIQNYGYVAVALLIAAENIFPPIPSELILTFTGFLTLSVPGAIIASTIGAFIGAVTLYWVGTFFDQDRLSRFAASKVGRRFGSPRKKSPRRKTTLTATAGQPPSLAALFQSSAA